MSEVDPSLFPTSNCARHTGWLVCLFFASAIRFPAYPIRTYSGIYLYSPEDHRLAFRHARGWGVSRGAHGRRGLQEFWEAITGLGARSLLRAVEFLIVWYVIYRLLLLVRGTRAWPIMGGLLIFAIVYGLSAYLEMTTLHYILEKATVVGGLALVVLFFPELRQVLEQFGSVGPWTGSRLFSGTDTPAEVVEEIVSATAEMSKNRVGALIVVERTSQLADVAKTGVALDAKVSAPAIASLFFSGNPLHDGAVIIRGARIVAAACELPMPESHPHPEYHMRHRAAIGVTERTDAVSIVVSEETGRISVAQHGEMQSGLPVAALRTYLLAHLIPSGKVSSLLGVRLQAARRKWLRKGA